MSTSLVLFMRQVFMDFFYSFRDKFTIYILAFCILSLPLSPALFQSLSLSLSLSYYISLSFSYLQVFLHSRSLSALVNLFIFYLTSCLPVPLLVFFFLFSM